MPKKTEPDINELITDYLLTLNRAGATFHVNALASADRANPAGKMREMLLNHFSDTVKRLFESGPSFLIRSQGGKLVKSDVSSQGGNA